MHLPTAYSLADGTISSQSQTATLSITSPRLTLLKGSDKVHLFTCKYEFGHGEHMHYVTAVQSITLFSPSELQVSFQQSRALDFFQSVWIRENL